MSLSEQSLTLEELHRLLPPRAYDAHKHLFGHVVVVGGDFGMPGSVRLAGEGALRVGAGLVSVVTHQAHLSSVVSGRPELMCYGVDSLTISIELLPTKSSVMKASAVVLGPGLGQTSWSKQIFDAALAAPPIPLVVDADALNWLSRTKEIPPRDNWVLTPHPGEAARLLKIKPEEVQADRKKAALALQKQYGGVIVLKGAQTLVVAENQQIYTCLAGNPGMASAGMGDLLSGIIAGLIGEGLTPWQAAAGGVFIHATAGDRVAAKQGERGLLASDLLAEIPLILNNKLH